MFTDNPFVAIADLVSPGLLQAYVVAMFLAVVAGTVFDLRHKRSAEFFIRERKQARAAATRQLGSAERASIVARTLAHDVATFGEFCNPKRRVSHILMFYGFVLYLVATVAMVFAYPGEPAPPALPLLWNLGALMVLVGGYWFFFFLRVDVVHDGRPRGRLGQADIFIVSLLASVSLALVFEFAAIAGHATATRVAFVLYLLFTTLLFVSVPWSKFGHMFYKPAMAYERRRRLEDGSSDLPAAARRHQS